MPVPNVTFALLKMQFRKNPSIPNDRSLPREYTSTFVIDVSNLTGNIFTFEKLVIPLKNSV